VCDTRPTLESGRRLQHSREIRPSQASSRRSKDNSHPLRKAAIEIGLVPIANQLRTRDGRPRPNSARRSSNTVPKDPVVALPNESREKSRTYDPAFDSDPPKYAHPVRLSANDRATADA